jgi:malate/lactate dehydrogenase
LPVNASKLLILLGLEASIFMLSSVAAARHGSNCPLKSPACLRGEYGVHNLFVGVPVELGAQGIERIFEVKLTEEEDTALKKSAAAVNKLVDLTAPKLGLTQAASSV